MITKNKWIVRRMKNPYPKTWPGPWFSFGKSYGNVTGQAHYSMLASYIEQEAYTEVQSQFKCLQEKNV